MSDKVKVRVHNHHFKNSYSVGEKTANKEEPVEVSVNQTVRNGVQAGTLELVEGSLAPEKDEKEFQKDDAGGEKVEETDDAETRLEDKTVDELKELCEENSLKKSGNKDQLIERLKNER